MPHVEFEDLEEADEDDKQIQIEEIDENNFSMLREIQRQHISKSFHSKLSKKDVQLVQTTSSMNEDLSVDSASEIDLDSSISSQADAQSKTEAQSTLKQK